MNEPQKKYLTTRERICFTVGAFGRSGIYTLMSMFTLVFFQNGAGLSLSVSGHHHHLDWPYL